jgi:hypothetical protein
MNIYSRNQPLAGTAIAALVLCFANVPVLAATISKAEYTTAKDRISAVYKEEKSACAALSGNAKDICREKAKGKEKIARAEVEYGYSGKAADASKVVTVKADTAYAVAKEMCDDKSGNAKSVCREEAKAIHTKAIADSKLVTTVNEAKKDTVETKTDADYKVATEKCDMLAGEAKSNCVIAAKVRFNKT